MVLKPEEDIYLQPGSIVMLTPEGTREVCRDSVYYNIPYQQQMCLYNIIQQHYCYVACLYNDYYAGKIFLTDTEDLKQNTFLCNISSLTAYVPPEGFSRRDIESGDRVYLSDGTACIAVVNRNEYYLKNAYDNSVVDQLDNFTQDLKHKEDSTKDILLVQQAIPRDEYGKPTTRLLYLTVYMV